jgi:hypothetical protein
MQKSGCRNATPAAVTVISSRPITGLSPSVPLPGGGDGVWRRKPMSRPAADSRRLTDGVEQAQPPPE